MKQVTTRELMTMKAEKRKELMKEQFVIGERTAGKNGTFYPMGVYTPAPQKWEGMCEGVVSDDDLAAVKERVESTLEERIKSAMKKSIPLYR